ncbi:MAG: diadenylate cyclase [Desulfobulbaceae bacterium]|nr:diadenylate cyclase [Desulfobulbaceae bacterium]
MEKQQQANILTRNALRLCRDTESNKVFLFLNSDHACETLIETESVQDERIVLVIPKGQELPECLASKKIIHTWSGNQTRFSRIKYAFLQGVLLEVIQPTSKIVCVLGPWERNHLDTITIHDLALSWSEEFPFDPNSLITKKFFHTVIAVVDIALDIGALGREGKPVGTTFIIGNITQVMRSSHQAIFNPFRGYPEEVRNITSQEVVESIKELAQLDGAFVISGQGIVEAAGRHLDAVSTVTRQLKGLGSRHRAAAGITMYSEAIAVVVSESTGRVTIFDNGSVVAVLEPVISRRVV